MKMVIVAGGSPPSKKLLLTELTAKSLLIAADGGANCLDKYQITPDYIIGDLDSISEIALNNATKKQVNIERHLRDKDTSDARLALAKALEFDPTQIIILGCLGGKRVDHLYNSFGLLDLCLTKKIKAAIKDDFQTIVLSAHSLKILNCKPSTFSLQSYGSQVTNLSISGGKYLLHNYQLNPGDPLTLSNEFTKKPVTINFDDGKLLIFINQNLSLDKIEFNI